MKCRYRSDRVIADWKVMQPSRLLQPVSNCDLNPTAINLKNNKQTRKMQLIKDQVQREKERFNDKYFI